MEMLFALYMTIVGPEQNDVVVIASGISGYDCIDRLADLEQYRHGGVLYFLSCERDFAE
jgi:hypothetical protein